MKEIKPRAFMSDDLTKSKQPDSLNDSLNSVNETSLSREAIDSQKVRVSIDLDSEVLARIKHLTNDPSRVIETAIQQWLNGERNDRTDLTRTFRRNPPVPPQGEWND